MSNIFFHLAGRLGNQLFQFAFAHQLSSYFNKEVSFFVDRFHHPSNYAWNISSQMGSCEHVTSLVQSDIRGFLLKASDGLFSRSKSLFEVLNDSARIMRTMDAFDFPKFPDTPPSLVTGFYMNSASIERSPIFLKELEDYISQSVDISRYVPETDYEIVHIRGTDMKKSIYGTLDHNYYMKFPKSEMPRYVVTDDTHHAEFVSRDLDVVKVFTPEEINPWEAIKLMRNSKKTFASNSTLAWWGGYLCLGNGGQAVFPRPFYRENVSASDSLHVDGFNYFQASFD